MKPVSSPGHRYGFPVRRGVSVHMRLRVVYDVSEVAEGETLYPDKGAVMDAIYPNRPKRWGRFGPLFTSVTTDPGGEGEPIGLVLEGWTATGTK